MDLTAKCDASCPSTALVLVEKRVGGQLLDLALCGAHFRMNEVSLFLDRWRVAIDDRAKAGAR